MTSSSTPATGKNVARRITLGITVAVLAGGLAACGGGGGADPGNGSLLPTGTTVNTLGTATSTSPTFAADAAVALAPAAAGQALLAAGAAADGGDAIAWLGTDALGGGELRWQRFDAQGAAAGSVHAAPVDTMQGTPAAAVLPDGGLVLASAQAVPDSVDTPWITRSSIRVQRFDAAGAARSDVDVGVVRQNRIGATTMQYAADPAVARWEDGSFLVAWAQVQDDGTGVLPQFMAQRFDATGQPRGAAVVAAQGEPGATFAVTTTANGGWILTTTHRLMGRTVLRYQAFDGAAAPVLPAGAPGVAEGSLLVALSGGGTAVLSPVQAYGALALYGADGQPQGSALGLPAPPVAATALPDGGLLLVMAGGPSLVAQRLDAQGQAVGQPVPLAAPSTATPRVAALAGRGAVLGWTGGNGVMAQRLR